MKKITCIMLLIAMHLLVSSTSRTNHLMSPMDLYLIDHQLPFSYLHLKVQPGKDTLEYSFLSDMNAELGWVAPILVYHRSIKIDSHVVQDIQDIRINKPPGARRITEEVLGQNGIKCPAIIQPIPTNIIGISSKDMGGMFLLVDEGGCLLEVLNKQNCPSELRQLYKSIHPGWAGAIRLLAHINNGIINDLWKRNSKRNDDLNRHLREIARRDNKTEISEEEIISYYRDGLMGEPLKHVLEIISERDAFVNSAKSLMSERDKQDYSEDYKSLRKIAIYEAKAIR